MYHDRKLIPQTVWTKEQDATLVEMAAAGHSASEISRALGGQKTRSAVIGRATRRGIKLGQGLAWVRKRDAARVKVAPAPPRAKVAPKPAAAPVASPVAVPEPAPAPVHVHTREGKPLLSLGACDCRWPLGGPYERARRFCAEPAMGGGRPYCREHWLASLSRDAKDSAIAAEARAAHRRRTAGVRF